MHHHAREQSHQPLQNAVVIEHRKKRRHEQDRRQRFEREDEQEFLARIQRDVTGPRQISENEFCTLVGKIDETDDDHFCVFKNGFDERHFQHQQREDDLQHDAPADGAPIHGPEIRRKQRDDAKKTKHTGNRLPARANRSMRQISRAAQRQYANGNGESPAQGGGRNDRRDRRDIRTDRRRLAHGADVTELKYRCRGASRRSAEGFLPNWHDPFHFIDQPLAGR